MLANRIDKLEKQLAAKKKRFKIWCCPEEPPPNAAEYDHLITYISPDGCLTDEGIKLKARYLAEFKASKL